MTDLVDMYNQTEPAPLDEALTMAATLIRLRFTQRAGKHGVDEPEVRRLMACHRALVGRLEAERRPVK